MNKSQLLLGLREKNARWHALLDEIGLERMDELGVNGDWSMTDLVAHLTGWNWKLVADLHAAERGEPEPAPPWPAKIAPSRSSISFAAVRDVTPAASYCGFTSVTSKPTTS